MTLVRPAVLLALTLSATAAGAGSPPVALSENLEVELLAPGVWLYRSTFVLTERPIESNGLVVEGSGGALVIDTPWDDKLTGILLDWVDSELGGVGAVVATHFHPDRLGGIAEVHRRGIASYGHEETARLAAENDLPPPRTTFSRELVLSTGLHRAELYFPGADHTADNTVVWLPDQGVLFGGCLLKATRWGGLGFIGDAVIESWAASLELLLERYPQASTVVPGHGEAGDLEIVRHTRDLVLQHRASSTGEPAADRHRGVSWVAQPYEVTAEHVDALVGAGVDRIVQSPFGWQAGVDGTEVELHTDGRIYWGERDVGLEVTTRLAQERGIRTLLKPHTWLAGAYFWKWYPRAPAPDNADFTPQGKPAERVMSGWYGGA